MTKADIARIVYERHGGISNREAARLVEIIFETIKGHLGDGEKVQITGFGTFLVRQKTGAARTQSPDWRGDADQAPQLGRLPPLQALRRRPRDVSA